MLSMFAACRAGCSINVINVSASCAELIMVTSVPQLPISGHNATEDYKTKVLVAF